MSDSTHSQELAAGVSSGDDVDIITFVCEHLLADYTINTKLLLDWKSELTDTIGELTELTSIVEELVLALPIQPLNIKPEESLNRAHIIEFLRKFNSLDDEIYHDLKLILFELFLHSVTILYSTKIKLMRCNVHELIIDNLLLLSSSVESTSWLDYDHHPLIIGQHIRLIINFMELGCEIKLYKKILLQLFDKQIKNHKKLIIIELLHQIHSKYPSHFDVFLFNDFQNSSISIPFSNEFNSLRCFTLQSWFKLNSSSQYQGSHPNDEYDDDNNITTLFLLSSSSNSNTSILKIQLVNQNQFLVEILDQATGSRMQFTFNQILYDSASSECSNNQGYVHFALTYDNYANLNLYIDGEYSESIPCPEIQKVMTTWNKFYIGTKENPGVVKHDELLIRNLTVLNTSLTNEWINFLFNLGLDFNWDFKDFNDDNLSSLLNQLGTKGLANVGLKIFDIKSGKTHRKGGRSSTANGRINFHNSLNDRNNRNSVSSNSSIYSENFDKIQSTSINSSQISTNAIESKTIVSFLSKSKLAQSNIVFSIHDSTFINNLETPKASKILAHHSNSIHGALYSLGGASLILRLIELGINSEDKHLCDTFVYTALSFLFQVLQNSWRISKEFDNFNGYGILQILLSNYKTINPSFTFKLVPELQNKSGCSSSKIDDSAAVSCHENNALKLLLSHTGYDFLNPFESIIVNTTAYRFLILDFELFLGSDDFSFFLYHFQILSVASKYNGFNNSELNRTKLLKKFVQFLKSPTLMESKLNEEALEQLSLTLNCIIRCDTSVETIRSLSLFIIYALYHDTSPEFGVITLKSLTQVLCDPLSSIKILKKFSRSITIHWILLLFNYKQPIGGSSGKDVAKCGLTLLTKLLKILGPRIIKRFFQANHGLDILTHFLKDWWHDDNILSLIFLSSFGIDTSSIDGASLNLISILQTKSYTLQFGQLVMPDFLILLNNLVLNSMYTLSLRNGRILSATSSPARSKSKEETNDNMEISLNVLHLINQYAESVDIGIENFKSLQTFYCRKEWLEGAFELVGHLKVALTWAPSDLLSNFQACYDRFVSTLSKIFVSKLLNVKEIFKILDSLNDITKTIILDIIFPHIFQHINEFVTVSNFIFNEKDFLEGVSDLICYYYNDFINRDYYISLENVDIFLTCNLSIIEIIDGANSSYFKFHGHFNKLKKCLGHVIVLKFLKFSEQYTLDSPTDWVVEFDPRDELRLNKEFGIKMDEAAKSLLYRQITVLNPEVLDTKKLSYLIDLFLGNLFRLKPEVQFEHSEHILNFLRTCYMTRQGDFQSLLEYLSSQSEYSNSQEVIFEFFNNLVTKNDEETIRAAMKYPTLKNIVLKNFHFHLGKFKEGNKLHVLDMIKVMLNNGGKLGFMNSIYIKSFEKDCDQLKILIISGELIKFNRAIQDQQENAQFYISNYLSLKVEINRLISQEGVPHYVLDYIENVDRMKKRLIIEDQLSDSEKLSYNLNIPIKQVDDMSSEFDDYDTVVANSGIDTLSLSTDNPLLDGEDGFEMIDDLSESTTTTYEDKNRKVIRSLYMGDQIMALWNISQINGLVPIESLMILGSSHIYLIDNYFHCPDGNVIDAQDAPPELRDPYLQLISSQSSNFLKNDNKNHRNKSWGIEKLSCISKRQFLLRDTALEMFFNDGASILLTCISTKDRDSIYGKLSPYATGKGIDYDLAQSLQLSSPSASSSSSSSSSFLSSKFTLAFTASPPSAYLEATRKWKMGEMSNFYYLMIINTFAGRTFNDLTQYPVFPWVIADYTSETLDLSNPKTFRDLSKPMGGQTSPRAEQFRDRFEALDSLQDHDAPPFHYGTHYSSAMIVTSFLIRLKPYVQSYLVLQGGKFDHADRLFYSIEKAWTSASRDNTTDVRELTPEFFYLPEFLVNSNNFELGTLQSGEALNDVKLPPWAKGDPQIFIAKNREALESPYVSSQLHLWIDLIFGLKQNGVEAIKSLNVFHHLSYNGAINLDNINDEVEKRAIIGMINNFGQTPMKVFHKSHVAKEVLNIPNYYLTLIDTSVEPKLTFESKLKLPIEKLEKSSKSGKWVGRPNCIVSEDELLIRKASTSVGSIIVNTTTLLGVHLTDITSILQIGQKLFLTGSDDGLIQVWKCSLKPTLSLQFQCLLRGHISKIKTLRFSKTFKVGLSVDADGVVIMWDLTRFKFIKKLKPPTTKEHPKVHIAISNDTGNFATIFSTRFHNILTVYTINGEVLITKNLKPGAVTSIGFGSINDCLVNSGTKLTINNHTFWSHEMLAIANGSPSRSVDIYELRYDNSGKLQLQEYDSVVSDDIQGDITTLELFKASEVDGEDKLIRGKLRLIVGDSTGRVYYWQ